MDEEWSVKYDDVYFNQFLFVTGDKKKWLIMGREAILGSNFHNKNKLVLKSSLNAEPHKVRQ